MKMDSKDIKHDVEKKLGDAEEFLQNGFKEVKKEATNLEHKAFEEKGIIEEKVRNAVHKK